MFGNLQSKASRQWVLELDFPSISVSSCEAVELCWFYVQWINQNWEILRSRITRLRFHDDSEVYSCTKQNSSCVGGDNSRVLDGDMNSMLGRGVALSDNAARVSSLGSLAKFGSVNYTPEKMAKFQQQDPEIGVVVKWLKSDSQRPSREIVVGHSPSVRNYWLNWDLLKLIDGVLFWTFVNNNGDENLLLVVPKVLQKEILVSTHDSITSAHLGITKTYSKLRTKFHWYKMKESVELQIKQCEKCAFRKRPLKIPRSP